MFRKIITLVLISVSFFTQAQKLGAELNFGLASASDKVSSDSQFNHVGVGFSYDINETWSAKLDLGLESFQYRSSILDKETGVNSTRISLQGVYNLTSFLDSNAYNRNHAEGLNLLGHFGAGVTMLKSDVNAGTDTIGSLIFGLTPRYPISKNLFVTLDASAIINIKQHFGFNGEYYYPTTDDNFTATMFNFTLGLQYKFGK